MPFSQVPATSFDFGTGGVTGSCNRGGELLQITSPSPLCGFVCARGDFPDTPDSILARSQRYRGGKSTFGLKLSSEGSDYAVGGCTERGSFNFRWPVVEYSLERKDSEPGVLSLLSFVRDGTLFQVMRLRPGEILSSKWNRRTIPKKDDKGKTNHRIVVTAGGKMQFSCRCGGLEPQANGYKVGHDTTGFVRNLCNECFSNSPQHAALSMQVFVDGDRVTLRNETSGGNDNQPKGFGDTSFSTTVPISPGKATTIIATLRFCNVGDVEKLLEPPESEDIYKYIALDQDCYNATALLWGGNPGNFDSDEDGDDFNSYFSEICLAGRCLERLLSVNSLPVETDLSDASALLNSTATDSRVDLQAVL